MSSSFKSPQNTIKSFIDVVKVKNESPISNVVILSFLAGAYIAFGGLLAEVVSTGMASSGFPPGLIKLIMGAVFPVGLMLTIIAGAELFTGNNMYMAVGLLSKKSSWGKLAKNWSLSWIFNFVGALFVAYVLAYLSGIMTADPYKAGAISIAMTKSLGGVHFLSAGKMVASITPFQAFIRAIGCNWLVCLAVYLAVASDDIIGKIVGIWFPVMAFVAIGFEHCVANMFFIPLGMFLGAPISWGQLLFNNLIPVTIGNIIGGAIFVGLLYWYVYLRGIEI
jgi:formate/nitrite transporter